ncbi:unnamed protein product [Staurois parvus]|uniref:Uncharacterized protein n=1 Tax=Staurois parvus TaxID=386267 RepID=A0ABN9AT83_9NEOB|nr:unnamed protein product [Staurois parvus]
MPASVFRVPFPASVGTYGGQNRREIPKCQINLIVLHYCTKPFHIHFVPSALSCALPAFFTVLSAWKLINIHGIQKASL